MNTRIDIRIPLKSGFRAVFSNPLFLLWGAAIAVPKGILQLSLFDGTGFSAFDTFSRNSESVSFQEALILLVIISGIFLAGSSGIVALVSLMSRHENGDGLSFSSAWISVKQRMRYVVALEMLLMALVIAVGSILSIPSDLAAVRGLESLSRGLSYSALGLLLSISLVLFFLRQYAALYLSLSKISLRSALENATRLFRLHIKETVLLSISLLLLELVALFVVSDMFLFVQSLFGKTPPFLSGVSGTLFEWVCVLGVLSMIEAWKWASWTSFFRMIALPKDSERSVLQKTETVLQQESAVSLDEA